MIRELLDVKNIQSQFKIVSQYYTKYLSKFGVQLPALYRGSSFTKNALTLVYLSYGYPKTKSVSKQELTQYISHFHPGTVDVQQGRHLAAQSGWYIISSRRNDYGSDNMPANSYKLVSLEEPYPDFTHERRTISGSYNFIAIKANYKNRCATCGSKEGERGYVWGNVKTILQQGHMDPTKPLSNENTIPQCVSCNQADRNRWVYDKKGRVVAVANPEVILASSADVQRKAYLLLKEKFDLE